ncbi:hypothetical protein P3T37_005420 [Kitasatospora sp. MAA4]|uniref:hypothetical protein n=1 Tax=Kitasatospora sp. MAA4 TaxID=3035093 RepID=UPI0024745B87|nr:hypothetical protein [Kitasatospora sp. MAA4]MDH6136001.1 hypothetical protein [Kitasatospora sp. MAA4]
MNQLDSTTRRAAVRALAQAAPESCRQARWAVALGTAALTAVLATGCGIRPTAVPVDAGAPASRTACPSPVHVPAAATPAVTAPRNTGRPSPAAPSVVPTTPPPTGSLFSALPTPSPTPSSTPTCG